MKLHSFLSVVLCATALLLAMCKGSDPATSEVDSTASGAGTSGSAGAGTAGLTGSNAGSGAAGLSNGGVSGTGASGASTSAGGAAGAGGAAAGSSAGGAPSSSVSLRQACFAYAFASCSKTENCKGMSGLDCYQTLPDDCPDIVLSPGSTRTPEGLRACADEIKAFSCDQWRLGFRPACVTPGTRQVGESCLYHSQCASLLCSGSSSGCGQCLAPIAEGGSCVEFSYACADGLDCDGAVCSTPVLEPVQEYMDPDPIPSGGVCTATDRCEVGTVCVDPDGDSVGACEHPGTLDMPCKPALVSASEHCEYQLYCDAGHVCRALPTLDQPCAAITPTFSTCATGFTCNEQTNLCEAQLPLGAPCTDRLQCTDNQCRSPSNNYDTCIDDPSLGLDFPHYADCICSRVRNEFNDCVAGIDTCDTGTECSDGVCKSIGLIGSFAAACGASN